MDAEKKNRRIFIVSFAALGCGLVILLVLVLGLFYRNDKKVLNTQLVAEQKAELLLQKRVINFTFRTAMRDLLYLQDLVRIVDTRHSADSFQDALELNFRVFAERIRYYDQIRLIGKEGREFVRVNYRDGRVEVVVRQDLQDKSDRYYFTDTMELSSGQIYLSPLDLNIEHGKVEVPYRPMLRLALPLRLNEDTGDADFVLILNRQFGSLLEEMVRPSTDPDTITTLLLNSDGYFLVNEDDPEKTFAFMFPDRTQHTIFSDMPGEADRIYSGDSGQFRTDRGSFVWETVYPVRDSWINLQDSPSDVPEKILFSRSWKLVNHIDTAAIDELNRRRLRTYALFLVIIGFPALVLSFFIAQYIYRSRIYRNTIQDLARYDTLTQVPNRFFLEEISARIFPLALRHEKKIALLFLDLDGFKNINDTFGHESGDEVLVEVARRLESLTRLSDIVSRHGGDEFLVILQDIVSREDVARIAEKINRRIAESYDISGTMMSLSVSIGISLFPDDSGDLYTLIDQADKAMYKGKMSGKGRTVFYDEIKEKED